MGYTMEEFITIMHLSQDHRTCVLVLVLSVANLNETVHGLQPLLENDLCQLNRTNKYSCYIFSEGQKLSFELSKTF